jgi:hypothetical protein
MFKAVTSTAVHEAIKQAAEDVAYDAKMREPYVTMRDCEQYMEDRESGIRMRVPNELGAIPMRKNKDGVWEAKRAKKTD